MEYAFGICIARLKLIVIRKRLFPGEAGSSRTGQRKRGNFCNPFACDPARELTAEKKTQWHPPHDTSLQKGGQTGRTFSLRCKRRELSFLQPSVPVPNSSFPYSSSMCSFSEDPKVAAIPLRLGNLENKHPNQLHNWFPIDGRCCLSHLLNMSLKKKKKKIKQWISQGLPKEWLTWWALWVSLSCWQLVFLNKLVPAEVGWILSDPPELMSLKTLKTAPHFDYL